MRKTWPCTAAMPAPLLIHLSSPFTTGRADSRRRKQAGSRDYAKGGIYRRCERVAVLQAAETSRENDGMFGQRRLQYQRCFPMFHHSIENRAKKSRWRVGRIGSETKMFRLWIAQVQLRYRTNIPNAKSPSCLFPLLSPSFQSFPRNDTLVSNRTPETLLLAQ